MENSYNLSDKECKLDLQQRSCRESVHIQILHKGYTIVSKKFKSAQGSVYFVQDKETQEVFVLKLYKQEDLKSYIKEKNILIKLRDEGKCHLGFPLLISIMEGPNQSELVMEALGANLKQLQSRTTTRQFSTTTVFKIGIQLIERLEVLHSLNIMHNDIKPENVLVGKNDASKLYLIDFGLANTFVDDDGKHTSKNYLMKFSGNFLFASLNSCRGYNKSRRDDIESLVYFLVYLLNESQLPWSSFEQQMGKERIPFSELLRQRLHVFYTRKLFRLVPKDLEFNFRKVMLLTFNEKPDYEGLKANLRKCIHKINSEQNPVCPPSHRPLKS